MHWTAQVCGLTCPIALPAPPAYSWVQAVAPGTRSKLPAVTAVTCGCVLADASAQRAPN